MSIIDDQDLSKVVYNGTWVKGGSVYEYDNTVASSTTVGDSFTVTFKGTSIGVYGTIDATSGGVITSYSIDGGTPTKATAQAAPTDTFRQQFWSSSEFSLAVHKLHVTMVKVNNNPQPGEGTVWFDYFYVTDPTITSTMPLTPSSTSPTITNTAHQSAPVGAIVGSILGGLSLVLAIVLVFLFYRRRRAPKSVAQQSDATFPHGFGSGNTSVHPFLLSNGSASENSSSWRAVEIDPTQMMSRKSVAFTLPTSQAVDTNVPHARVSLPASTALAGKHSTPGSEHSQIDRQTVMAETSGISLPANDGTQLREEVSGERPSADVQIPEASASELPPVYSPV